MTDDHQKKDRGKLLSLELDEDDAMDALILRRLSQIKTRRNGGKAGFVRKALVDFIQREASGQQMLDMYNSVNAAGQSRNPPAGTELPRPVSAPQEVVKPTEKAQKKPASTLKGMMG